MFIAIAPKGQEYLYKTVTRLKAPKRSAERMAEILTESKYKLRDGEVWHAYETEFHEDEMYGKVTMRKGAVYVHWDIVYP